MNVIARPEESWQSRKGMISQLTTKQEIATSVSDLLAMTTRVQKEMDVKLEEW